LLASIILNPTGQALSLIAEIVSGISTVPECENVFPANIVAPLSAGGATGAMLLTCPGEQLLQLEG
jgi:hypothetical protein